MIFSWFRRRRERQALALITQAIAEHALYEIAHGQRQAARMEVVVEKLRPKRHDYDHDQRVLAVLQRAQRKFSEAGKKPPLNLLPLVEKAVAEVSDDSR
jgi:hypothetical protein